MDDYYVVSNHQDDHGSIYFIRNDLYYEENGAMKLLSNAISKFIDELTNEELIEIGLG